MSHTYKNIDSAKEALQKLLLTLEENHTIISKGILQQRPDDKEIAEIFAAEEDLVASVLPQKYLRSEAAIRHFTKHTCVS